LRGHILERKEALHTIKVSVCSHRPILEPCSLEGLAFQVDPYVGCQHHCYYCYALNQAETDWDREVQVHQDLVGQLRDELSGLEPQRIYVGWNSDGYQPVESGYRQTRKLLELLAERGFSISLLTKSDLVTRDIDLFLKMPEASVGISIAFQDTHTRRLFEANSPSNRRRVEALKRLHEAGIRTYTLICPVMPFITDVGELIDQAAPYADAIWVYALSIDREDERNWQNLRGILERHFPGLEEEYREIVFRAEHPYWVRLRRELEVLKQERGLELGIEL
jgi:DNA repair photolyase